MTEEGISNIKLLSIASAMVVAMGVWFFTLLVDEGQRVRVEVGGLDKRIVALEVEIKRCREDY